MAIKIPSKNIYDIDNPKIRDNVIDNVNVEQTVIKPNNDYEVSVYNEKLYEFDNAEGSFDLAIASVVDIQGGNYWEAVSYVRVTPKYKNNITLIINALKNNNFISKIYDGSKTNEFGEEESNIKYSIEYIKYNGDVSGVMNCNKPINPSESESTVTENEPYNITNTQNIGEIPKLNQSYEKSFSRTGYIGNSKALSEITEISDETNLRNIIFNLEDEKYVANNLAKILSGIEIVKLGNVINSADVNEIGTTRSLIGTYEKYEPLSIEITIYGDIIGIDLTDGSVTYGSGNKPFLLSGNELMQHKETINYANVKGFSHNGAGLTINGNENNLLVVNGTCVVPSGVVGRYHINLGVVSLPKGRYILKGMPKAIGMSALILHNTKVSTIAESFYEPIEFYLEEQQDLTFYFVVSDGNIFNNFIIAPKIININNSEYLANNILNQYANGKETATLLCDISDYYDESGEKVIDITTNKMSFRLHDEVIPYVYGADGKDKPMSKKQDGSAKVFEVVGSNIIYDGAVWQELTLLEKTQNN